MRAWILFLFVAASISGCLGSSSEGPAALDSQEAVEPEPQPNQEEPPEAGPEPASPEPEPAQPAATPVSIEDSLGYLVCAPIVTQPGWCTGYGFDIGGYWEGALKGNASTFTFTVEWTPATPASTELVILLVCVEGPACPSDAEILATSQGTSPLTLDAQGMWSNGTEMRVIVAPPNPTEPVGHYSQVRDGTAVEGEGTFAP